MGFVEYLTAVVKKENIADLITMYHDTVSPDSTLSVLHHLHHRLFYLVGFYRLLSRMCTDRERNREHAKRSRVRKKFLLDSLQRSVDALQV